MDLDRLSFVLAAALLAANARLEAKELVRRCGSGPRYEQLATSGAFRDRMATLSLEAEHQYALVKGPTPKAPARLTLPVVVHVLYNVDDKNVPTASNITDDQVRSQFAVLNHDYDPPASDARDKARVPLYFANLFGAPRLQFALAETDPEGAKTTGIVRVSTKTTKFVSTTDAAKKPAEGGAAPWDRSRYLNVWIVPDLVDDKDTSLFGYASWPAEPAAADGVVIWYRAFGTKGEVAPKYDLGRTTTHEIGHWLGLHHLWGDGEANANCIDDEVDDTPKQSGPHFQCPPGKTVSCKNDPDGDMYMNYMDYPPDACLTMFTLGQAARMRATLEKERKTVGRAAP
jgi:hypothetical protein